MCIAIIAPTRGTDIWKNGMLAIDPGLEIRTYPDLGDYQDIECAVVWNHPRGILRQFPKLKVICSMGAGVDHVISDPDIPEHIPITKIVDDRLSFSMSNYIMMAVLHHHRRWDKYMQDKADQVWDQAANPEVDIRIGIMGFGALGQDAGQKLTSLGFEVHGLSKSRIDFEGITTYGEEDTDLFLSKINVLVCLLPLVPENIGILNYTLFEKMERGSYLINVARGKHQVGEDIRRALDEGILSGAFLDVFEKEPLPKGHWMWQHPDIQISPHNASLTNPTAAIPQIIDNYRNALAGKRLNNQIDRSK
ncbi:MAG: glyoxylate/hydroxypyruvate reductase A, partial [Bacteroidota bacterium]